MTEFFELGRVLKPQGVKGEVKVEAYTDDLNRFYELRHVYMLRSGEYQKQRVESARTDGRYAYLKLACVNDRNAAEPLRGTMLYIDRAHAAKLPPGHFYISDLIGLAVRDETGKRLGELTDILQTGSKDVYVVALEEGGTLLFPSAPGVIGTRDVEGGCMTVDSQALSEVAVYDL